MQTIIDKFEQNFINTIQNKEKHDNSLKKQNVIESEEIPKIMEQEFESSQSCPFLSNERKKSYDSLSVGVSQADTLSQTSESSFFLSFSTPNYQPNSTNESTQIDKKDKDIPFYFGVEEYFKKKMPHKFTDYTQTKNYIHKNYYLQKNNSKETGIKIQKENIIQGNMPVQNFFYFPFVYYPINNFFFNHYSNAFSNNTKYNTKNIIKNDKEMKKDKKENEDVDKVKSNTPKNEDNAQHNYGKKDEIENGKNEQIANSFKKEGQNFNISFNKNYNNNYKRNKEYKKAHYYNNRYNNNSNNYQRHYNSKYSNYYYNDNELYQEERA